MQPESEETMVVCIKCGELSRPGTFCTRCGERLYRKVDEKEQKAIDALRAAATAEDEFSARYQAMSEGLHLEKEILARFRTYHNLRGTFWPGLRALSVPKGWKAIVYNQEGGVETELVPGIYTASKTGLGADMLGAFLASFRGTHLCLFMCRTQEFPVTFMVPEKDGPYRLIINCNIRSAEGFLGGAYLTMVMAVEDPSRLLATLGDRDKEAGVDEKSLWRRLKESFFPKGDADSGGGDFSAMDLWKEIRSEFVMIIGSAIANESILQMRDSLEVRNRVLDAIRTAMDTTLQRFGVRLLQVTSFRFLSPGQDELLGRESDLARRQAEVSVDNLEAKVSKAKRDVAEEEQIDKADTERNIRKAEVAAKGDTNRAEIAESEATRLRELGKEATTGEAADRNRAAELERKKAMHASAMEHLRAQRALGRQFDREQKTQDVQAEITQEQARLNLGYEKAKKYLELKNLQDEARIAQEIKLRQADTERRIAYVQAIAAAKLPSDSILALQLADNPQLASAYAEAVKARSYEDRLQLQKEFEAKLLQINTTDREQVHALLTEGIKQIGNVMSEAQKKQRPTVVAAGSRLVEVTTDAPPALPPTKEPGKDT